MTSEQNKAAIKSILDSLPRINIPKGADEGTKVVALAKSVLAGGYQISLMKEAPSGDPVIFKYDTLDEWPGDSFVYEAFEDGALISCWMPGFQMHFGQQYPNDLKHIGSNLADI